MNKYLKQFLIIANFIGFLWVLIVYVPQLTNTNPLLWILVIDCSLACLLFLIFLFGYQNPYFEALMRIMCFKYGLWTIIVTLSGPLLLAHPFAWANILGHFGLMIESFFLMKQKLEIKHFIPGLIFLLINDFSDYFLLTHPPINELLFFETMIFTFSLSILSVILFLIIYRKKK